MKDFLAGVTPDADQEKIDAAHAVARKQLTGVAVASGEPVPPLALTQAMLDLAALTPPGQCGAGARSAGCGRP